MKISIIGYSGTGKSTFGSNLSTIHNINVTHLDQLFFNPNWEEVDRTLFQSRIDEVLIKDTWILEGNYSRHSLQRLEESDEIFIFRFNRFRSLYNLIKRRIKYNNKVRPSAAKGCYEQLDLTFIKFVLYDSRKKERKIYFNNIIQKYSSKVIVFKNHKQVNKYLKNLK